MLNYIPGFLKLRLLVHRMTNFAKDFLTSSVENLNNNASLAR